MSIRENQRKISQVIFKTLLPHLTGGGSSLSELQEIYSQKRLCFKQQISQRGRTLTKKLFGTAIRCISLTPPYDKFTSSSNLIGLAYIILEISFKDEDVLRLILQQLNQSETYIKKLFLNYNPYSSLNIDASEFQKILAQIILKINSLRSIFSIGDILKDYYIASQTFSLLLRVILCKLNYTCAEFCQKKLQKTSQIFTILCEYFDIIMIARKQNNSLKVQKKQADKSQIYLFSNYNLFISSVDNSQFCVGKYYNNETELVNSEKQIRKSIVQFLYKKQNAIEKLQSQKCQNQLSSLRMSQVEMDLGLSTSALMSNVSENTPFFSSNLSTPQFGKLFESKQFRKSIDGQMQSPINPPNEQNQIDIMFDGADSLNLGTVQQQINTPNSEANFDGKDQFLFQKKQKSYFEKCEQILMKKFAPYILAESVKGKLQKSNCYDSQANIPLSPPTIPSFQTIQTQEKLKQSKRDINYVININSQLSRSKEKNKSTALQIKQVKENKQILKINLKKRINQDNDQESLILKFTEKPKFAVSQQSQSPLREKQSPQYFKVEQQNQLLKINNKKKDASYRKYSINQNVNNQFKEINKKFSTIHHSNHFVNDQIINVKNEMYIQQLALTQQNIREQEKNKIQKQQSKSTKKMQLNSNIVNVKVTNFCTEIPNKDELYRIHKNYLKAKLLRNSKSSKSSRMPQATWENLQKSRNVSQHIFSNRKSINNKINPILVNSVVSQKILTFKSKQEYMSPRFSKVNNKFPEFLRNTHKFNRTDKLNKQYLIKQKNQIQQRVKKLNLKKKSSFKKAITQQKQIVLNSNISPKYNIITKSNTARKQTNPEGYFSNQNQTMKHIKSEPRLLSTTQNQNQNNLLCNDFNHRPWISIPKIQNLKLAESKTQSISSRQSLNQLESQKIQQFLRPSIKSLVSTQQNPHNVFQNIKYPISPINGLVKHQSPIKTVVSFPTQTIPSTMPVVIINIPKFQASENQNSRISHYQLQNSILKTQTNFGDQSHKSSMVISKTECYSPSTQWSAQNQLLMKSSNYRKHIWENAFNNKNW